jgi:2-dehydropantoate 2-reductase
MRVAVVGIGGVGGYYGGKLAARFALGSEYEVLFFCRGAHLDAIRRDGLKLIAKDGNLLARPALATDSAADMGLVDVAIFAVKGYSLPEAAAAMRPAIGASTVVIPLGNGVDNDEVLQRELGVGRILNGCVYISTHIEVPGVVEQTGGSRKLFFGSPDGVVEPYCGIETVLKDAGIDATLSDHILRDVWAKFIFIDAISGVTSLRGVTIGMVLGTPELKDMLVGLMREVEKLSRRLDVGLPAGIIEQAIERAAAFPPDTRTSMQLDVEKGAHTELDTMLGYVLRKGREMNVPTPRHAEVYEALARIVRQVS